MGNDDELDDESDRGSVISAIRKTRSIDASCLDMRSIGDVVNSAVAHMPRAKSEFNLISATVEGIYILGTDVWETEETDYELTFDPFSPQMGSTHDFTRSLRLFVVGREPAELSGGRPNRLGRRPRQRLAVW